MPSLPTSIHSKTDLRSFLENWQKGLKNIEEEMTKGYIQLCFKTPNARTTLASPQTSSNDQEDILNKILASKSDNAILELALVLTKMRLLVSEGPMRLSYNSYDELLRLATYLIQQLTKVSEKQAGEEVCYSLEKIFKQAAQSLSDFIRKYFT